MAILNDEVFFLSNRYLLQAKAFASSVDTISGQIVAGKFAYCHTTLQTNDPTHQEQFYRHIAEQHLGIGVDSYAQYSGHPVGSLTKLLRSEFELDISIVSPQFHSVINLVKQGACCLWCKEILDVRIKPLTDSIQSSVTSLLTVVGVLEKGIANGKMTLSDAHSTIQKDVMQKKVANVQDIISRLQYN